MNGKRICCLVALGTAWALGGSADAAGPFDQLLSLRRVEADPDKSYRVTEDNGPWMIMACSFSGDGAEQQARELVLELRKRYKLPAYVYKMHFAFGEETGRGFDRRGRAWRMGFGAERGGGGTSEIQEVAVLVGDYQAVDDPDAQRTLRKLKYTRPQSLEVNERKKTSQSLAGWRMIQKDAQAWLGSNKKDKGPMGHAFVTTNPLLPKDVFAPKGIDPLVVEMNKGAKHSLLNCPGKYTVQVATFRGNVIIEQSEIQAIENGDKKMKSQLDKAAMKAHKLTEALRIKGWEAYEFHDRNASIVTVGSFHSVGTPRPDGKTEINPGIYEIMQIFGAGKKALAERKVNSLVGIPFDIQAVPVEVPKRSISRELASDPL